MLARRGPRTPVSPASEQRTRAAVADRSGPTGYRDAMQPLPRFWARRSEHVEIPDHPARRDFDLVVWGSSDLSRADAERDAGERLAALVASGGPARAPEGWYYPARRLPEELLSEVRDGDELLAVVTRNRYGAEVLNTDAVLITDIDLPQRGRGRDRTGSGAHAGLLARLLGRGRRAADADPVTQPDSTEVLALQRIDDAARARPDLGWSTYRTRAGLRVIVTGSGAAPDSPEARRLMESLASDPLYVTLCRVHETYRARLTPKPWRVGLPATSRGPAWSVVDPPPAGWLTRYREAAREVAVCRLIGRTGAPPSAREQRVINVHDRATRIAEDLPLA